MHVHMYRGDALHIPERHLPPWSGVAVLRGHLVGDVVLQEVELRLLIPCTYLQQACQRWTACSTACKAACRQTVSGSGAVLTRG